MQGLLGRFHGQTSLFCIIDLFKVKLTAEKRVVPKRKAVVPISNYYFTTNSKAINFTIRYSAVGCLSFHNLAVGTNT